MIRRSREAGLPEPTFRVTDGFSVMIPRIPLSSRSGKNSGKNSVKTADQIIKLMQAQPEISVKEIAGRRGKTLRAVEMQANNLKAEERIGRVGSAKGGRWVVQK